MSARNWVGPIATGVRRAASLGNAGTLVEPRSASAIGSASLDDVGPLMGAGPASAIGTDWLDVFGTCPLGEVGPCPLDNGTNSARGPRAPPPHDVAPLKLVKPVKPVSTLVGVGRSCSPASAGAVLAGADGAGGAAGSGWFPTRAVLAATTVPVAIAAVSIRSWSGEDFRACFDMGGSFS